MFRHLTTNDYLKIRLTSHFKCCYHPLYNTILFNLFVYIIKRFEIKNIPYRNIQQVYYYHVGKRKTFSLIILFEIYLFSYS